jgi:hypothetical protein
LRIDKRVGAESPVHPANGEKGDSLMERIFPLHAQDLSHAMNALSVTEQQAATALLRKLQTMNHAGEP